MPRDVRTERLALGAAALLTPAHAARLVGGDVRQVQAWMRAAGLIRRGPAGERVIWGDVLAAYEAASEDATVEPAPIHRGTVLRLGTL